MLSRTTALVSRVDSPRGDPKGVGFSRAPSGIPQFQGSGRMNGNGAGHGKCHSMIA